MMWSGICSIHCLCSCSQYLFGRLCCKPSSVSESNTVVLYWQSRPCVKVGWCNGCREFREDQFLELVGPCFQLLANFMLSAAEFDSQLQVRRLDLLPRRFAPQCTTIKCC